MDLQALSQRLEALEAREAIRDLKHHYLACCDNKDTEGFRNCFADGEVQIDYGNIGQFDRADDLVAVFRDIACHPHMLEWHLSSNPCITLLGDGRARGNWSLHYQLLNAQEQNLTQIGGDYDDEYLLTDEGWKILKTRFSPRSCLVLKLDENAVRTIYAGSPQT